MNAAMHRVRTTARRKVLAQEPEAMHRIAVRLILSFKSESELQEECAKHIARYKHPKAFIFVEQVLRSPSGKADYRWAKERASQG